MSLRFNDNTKLVNIKEQEQCKYDNDQGGMRKRISVLLPPMKSFLSGIGLGVLTFAILVAASIFLPPHKDRSLSDAQVLCFSLAIILCPILHTLLYIIYRRKGKTRFANGIGVIALIQIPLFFLGFLLLYLMYWGI